MPKQTSVAHTTKNLSRHPIHFHKSGDITLQVRSVLFRVHRDKLSLRSDVFKDLFRSSHVRKAEKSGKIPNVDLQDDPSLMALLLDFMYQYEMNYKNTKKCLQLALLADKYDVPLVVSTCLGHIRAQLPTGATPRDLRAVERYRSEPELVIMALRVAILLDVPELLPWGIYLLSTESDDTPLKHREFVRNEDDLWLSGQFSKEIKALRKFLPGLVEKWNEATSEHFLDEECSAYGPEEECLRRVPDDYREDDGDLLLDCRSQDPICDVWALLEVDTIEMSFCRRCRKEWISLARAMVKDLADDIFKFIQGL